MTTLAVVIALDPEGQITLQLLGSDQNFPIVIEVQLEFDGGEEAFHHGVIPAATLGGHAADDLVALQKQAVVSSSVLAALIRVDQQLVRLNPAVTEGPVEGLNHQGGVHGPLQLPADDTPTEQIDPHRQVSPAAGGADVCDVAGPAAVRRRGLKVLQQQVLRHPAGAAAALTAGPERPAGSALEVGTSHEPGDAVTTNPVA